MTTTTLPAPIRLTAGAVLMSTLQAEVCQAREHVLLHLDTDSPFDGLEWPHPVAVLRFLAASTRLATVQPHHLLKLVDFMAGQAGQPWIDQLCLHLHTWHDLVLRQNFLACVVLDERSIDQDIQL